MNNQVGSKTMITSAVNVERHPSVSMMDPHSRPEDRNCTIKPHPHHDYRIALYYCYLPIPTKTMVTEHVDFHNMIGQRYSLGGRVRISPEGLNGVLSGKLQDLKRYAYDLEQELDRLHYTTENQRKWDLDIKYCLLREDIPVEAQLFANLVAKATKTVISLVDTDESQQQRSNRRRKSEPNKVPNNPHFVAQNILDQGLHQHKPATHLSPGEWDDYLGELTAANDPSKVVLLDCRNVYESNVGHFLVPQASTILTNTRKYAELPHVLLSQRDRLLQSDHIFMYCTGGVRCERASVFLQAMLENQCNEEDSDSPGETKKKPHIYQLHGGIQRYLEQENPSLYKGKNFVFDPRRTDPKHDNSTVGTCLLCHQPHDDYDNGHAPATNKEARCWNCRILILVCDDCRQTVACSNEVHDEALPRMYCGGKEERCLHVPPVRILNSER
jgi:predicted sulfurtransferase